jgi:apolipoprotein N-acyltransferase
VYFAGTLYWITHVMIVYGGFEGLVGVRWALPLAALINAALVAYLALFPAMFAAVMRRLIVAHGMRGVMGAPLVWVATELGRTYLFTGFPWVLLGYSQVSVLPIAQLASIVGVYGVSALVVSVSATAAVYAVTRGTGVPKGPLAFVALTLASVAVWGSVRASRGEWTRTGDPVRVGLIQGNVDQAEKENPARATATFGNYLALTRQAIGHGAELVIWPESSTMFYFEEEPASADRLRAIAREAHVPILLGSDQIERGEHGAPAKYYNAAFLVRADGTTAGFYRKMHLVPFGEYVPSLFFFAGRLVVAVSDFSPGDRPAVLSIDGHRISTAICYEIVYPALVRQFVNGGSELVTTITNDAWFGQTSAPYQHFAQASMRAIEEGRYLVRAANTGISGIVDPYGRVVAESGIFREAVIVGEARFLNGSTFYGRHGDIFAYVSVVVTLAMLFLGRR